MRLSCSCHKAAAWLPHAQHLHHHQLLPHLFKEAAKMFAKFVCTATIDCLFACLLFLSLSCA